MTMTRGKQQHAESERAGGVREGALTRRSVLGGLAALPVLYSIGSASPALATTLVRPGSVTKASDDLARGEASDDLARGVERRYNAPLLTPGTRLVLPAGIKAFPVHDYYTQPHLASVESAWPHIMASDGTTVDASIVPERGAPTRIAVLSGFTEGWYEVVHASGRADRVTWDARRLPFLWFYGEFGATQDAPFHSRFYTVALQAYSRNPYSRNTRTN
jgi:hypothetical protein